jgi:DNA-binding PadR family transcriptional regulator
VATEKQNEILRRLEAIEQRLEAIEHPRHDDTLGIPKRMRELDEKLAAIIAERDGPSRFGIDGLVEHAVYLKNEKGATGSDESTDIGDILDVETEALAAGLTGLAHPVRIAIFRSLLDGPKESHDLLEITNLNTTGQLYHHLSVMEKAGLVDRRTRNLWSATNQVAGMLFLSGAHLLAKWRGEVPG